MPEIDIRRSARASPEVVWRLLTRPDMIPLWSEAEVRLLAPRAGAPPGIERVVSVRICGVPVRLWEVIETEDPPSRLIYRVWRGGGLRRHSGSVTLEPRGAETVVHWQVGFEAWLRPAGRLMAWLVTRSLARSVDALCRQAEALERGGDSAPRA